MAETNGADLRSTFMETSRGLSSLMDLTAEDVRLLGLLDAVYGDDPNPADDEAVEAHEVAVEALAMEFAQNEAFIVKKVEAYLHVLKKLSMFEEWYRNESRRLAAKARSAENAQGYLKDRLLQAMQVMERDRLDTPIGSVRIQKNPGKVEVLAQEMVPDQYLRVIPAHYEVNKTNPELRAKLKAGEDVPGIAWVVTESVRLA